MHAHPVRYADQPAERAPPPGAQGAPGSAWDPSAPAGWTSDPDSRQPDGASLADNVTGTQGGGEQVLDRGRGTELAEDLRGHAVEAMSTFDGIAANLDGADWVVPAQPTSLRALRTLITTMAGSVGVPRDNLNAIIIAVNEVATNAVEHSGSDIVRVRWQARRSEITVTVSDTGVFATRGLHGVDGRGFGLSIASALADEVRIRAGKPGRPGTTVQLLFRCR